MNKVKIKIEDGMLSNTHSLLVGYNGTCWSGLPSLTKDELKSIADAIYDFVDGKN